MPEVSQPADKPNSVRLRPRGLRRDDHSSGTAIARGLERPTRWLGTGSPHRATLFGLAPCGVLPATDVTAGAVRSYRTFSPLPPSALRATVGKLREGPALRSTRSVRRRAVCFLCHFPSGCPARALAGALPCGVRTFLPPSVGDRLADCDLSIIKSQRPNPKTQIPRRVVTKLGFRVGIWGLGIWDFDYPSISCLMPYCSSFL